MTKVNIALVVSVVALVIAGLLYFGGVGSKALFGSTACSNITCLSGGLRLVSDAGGDFESDVAAVFNSTFKTGTNGTTFNRVNAGTCYVKPWATTIAASSTAFIDCQGTAAVGSSTGTYLTSALTGVTAGDSIGGFNLSTSTTCATGGLIVQGVGASTTPGYIQVKLYNACGTTFTWPLTGTASGTAYYVVTN